MYYQMFKTNYNIKNITRSGTIFLYIYLWSTILIASQQTFQAEHMVLDSISDGKRIWAATQSGQVHVFNITSGKKEKNLVQLAAIQEGMFPPSVYSISLSPTFKYIAIGTSIGEFQIFSNRNQSLINKVKIPGIENILVVRFLDEDHILTGLMDGTVRLFNWKNGDQIYQLKAAWAPIQNIQISPGKHLMAITSTSSIIVLAESKTGTIKSKLEAHTDAIYGLIFQKENKLFSSSKDKTLRLWDLDNGTSELIYQSKFYINSIAWDGKDLLAVHLPDYKIGLLQLSNRKIIQIQKGHTAFINTMYFLNHHTLVSSGNDARVIVHSLNEK